MKISLIAAMAQNRVIGRGNTLPWHLPADLKRFKERTAGHAVIMGRRTFESLDQALPDRRCIVVTRNPDYDAVGAEAAPGLDEALELAGDAGEQEVFILGGSEIYALALPRADRIYLTLVHADIAGDTYFPEFDPDQWALVEDTRHEADDRHAYAFSFRIYERKRSSTLAPSPSGRGLG